MKKTAITTTALLALIGIAHAADMPDLKEGLWSAHTVTTDNPGNDISDNKYSLCRSHAFDQHANDLAKNVKECAPSVDNRLGNRLSSTQTCKVDGTTISTKATIIFLGDTGLHSETHVTFTPAFYGKTDETVVEDWKYMGACPANIKPGDRVSPDGSIRHLWKH